MNTQRPGGSAGKSHILIVEREPIIASMLEAILAELGYESAVAYDLKSALAVIRSANIQMDAAIVGLIFRDGSTQELCHALTARGTPFAFCTEISGQAIEARWQHCLNIGKPFTESRVAATLKYILDETYQISR